MENFVKNFLAKEYRLDKSIFLQKGGQDKEKTFKIEYDGKIDYSGEEDHIDIVGSA